MRIEKTANILESRWMRLSLESGLTQEQLDRLKSFAEINFVLENYSNQPIEDYLNEIIALVAPTHEIYFVYVESKAQPKSLIRSRKGLFYQVRQSLAKEDRHEAEIATETGTSLMTGIVHMNPDNRDIILKNLINSNLRFAYLIKRNADAPPIDWTQFLNQIAGSRIGGDNLVTLHLLKIIADHADENRSMMRLIANGQDEEIIQFWVKDADTRKLLEGLEMKYRLEVEN